MVHHGHACREVHDRGGQTFITTQSGRQGHHDAYNQGSILTSSYGEPTRICTCDVRAVHAQYVIQEITNLLYLCRYVDVYIFPVHPLNQHPPGADIEGLTLAAPSSAGLRSAIPSAQQARARLQLEYVFPQHPPLCVSDAEAFNEHVRLEAWPHVKYGQ